MSFISRRTGLQIITVLALLAATHYLTAIGSAHAADPWKGVGNATQPRGTEAIPGRIVFWRSGKISSRITGRVDALPVRIGDRVKKGDVVARLNTEQLRADLAVAQKELSRARELLLVSQRQAEVEKVELNRQLRLKRSAAFSRARYEDAERRVAVAEARVRGTQAEIESQTAKVARRQLDIDLATIRAPYNAIVVEHIASLGSFLTIEDPHLMVLLDDTAAEIRIDLPVTRLANLAIGTEIAFSAAKGHKGVARVRSVLPSKDHRSPTRTMLLDPLKPGDRMLINRQSVTVYIPK